MSPAAIADEYALVALQEAEIFSGHDGQSHEWPGVSGVENVK